MNPPVQLYIDGCWTHGQSGKTIPIINPATGKSIGDLARAEIADLDRALLAVDKGFVTWSKTPALERYRMMRKAAQILDSRVEEIGRTLTTEQGKPLAQAKAEVAAGVDVIDWCAEEARRTYGRIIPSRASDVLQLVIKEPIGPVAAFSPWNFPINQAVRKISAALAAGCSIILKGPEETPGSCAALVQVFVDAGVPAGVINLVFGVPAEISSYLIPHPTIRKISFTGSTAVGKQLAALAGQHMKRMTMELGGHAPTVVFEDADVDMAINLLSAAKVRNSGQICISPTRFIVHEKIYDRFVNGFVAAARAVRVGDGMDPKTQMGPLAHERRVSAMESLVTDAAAKGAEVLAGGHHIGTEGYFFEYTVMTKVPKSARIMNEEPFGPVVPIVPFKTFEEAVTEANRLPYGLAAYAYTSSARTATSFGNAVQAGMISINHHGLALPETPFGGIKDSGYGSEGGIEAIEAYLNTKFITQRGL